MFKLFIYIIFIFPVTIYSKDLTSDNPYKVLELESSASNSDVNKAWRKLVFELHPDRNKGNEKESEQKLIKVNWARDIILKKLTDQSFTPEAYDSDIEFTDFSTRNPNYNPEHMAVSLFSTIKARSIYDRLHEGSLKDFVLGLNQNYTPSWHYTEYRLIDTLKYLEFALTRDSTINLYSETIFFLQSIFNNKLDEIKGVSGLAFETQTSLDYLYFEFWTYMESKYDESSAFDTSKQNVILEAVLQHLLFSDPNFDTNAFIDRYNVLRTLYEKSSDPIAFLKTNFVDINTTSMCSDYLNH